MKRACSAAEAGEQREHRMEKKLFLHSYQLTPRCVFADCCDKVQAQKEGRTKKLLLRALNCHCLLLKNTGRQDRYVTWIEATVVSLDCRKSSGDILGEIGT